MPNQSIKELEAELRRLKNKQAQQSQQMGKMSKKARLKKEIKDLKFKTSKTGRVVIEGKKIFGRIGTAFGQVAKNLEGSKRTAPKKSVKRPQTHTKTPSVDEMLRNMPQ